MRAVLEQKVRHKQGIAVTPRMREALRLLRLPQPELEAFILEQVEKNPFLELPDRAVEQTAWSGPPLADPYAQAETEQLAAGPCSVEEQLLRQLALSTKPGWLCRMAALLLEEVDDYGRLTPAAMDAFCQSRGVVQRSAEEARQYLLRLEPVGVGALSLAECFAVQLEEEGTLSGGMTRLLANLDCLIKGDRTRLAALCGVSVKDMEQMLHVLQRLDPYPYCRQVVEPVLLRKAELRVEQDEQGQWQVFVYADRAESLTLNNTLLGQISSRISAQERGRVREWVTDARWLLNVVAQRRKSLLMLGQKILLRQKAFLYKGEEALNPLTMHQIAQDMQVHESTVSRLVADKYVSTPDGVFPLRFFFTAGVGHDEQAAPRAAAAARACLRRVVREEKPDKPLSDSALVEVLKEQGFSVSRRTVVKYRQLMGIQSSFVRKEQSVSA